MQPFFTKTFGNPASRHHAFGWAARDAVEKARKQVSRLVGCDPREVVFTSGATAPTVTGLVFRLLVGITLAPIGYTD